LPIRACLTSNASHRRKIQGTLTSHFSERGSKRERAKTSSLGNQGSSRKCLTHSAMICQLPWPRRAPPTPMRQPRQQWSFSAFSEVGQRASAGKVAVIRGKTHDAGGYVSQSALLAPSGIDSPRCRSSFELACDGICHWALIVSCHV
jgi:hypothetical protein